MIRRLNAANIPGLAFEPAQYTPVSQSGTITNVRLGGRTLDGIRIRVTDYKKVEPLEAGIAVIELLLEHAREKGQPNLIDQPAWLGRLAGTRRLYEQLRNGSSAASIIASWKEEVRKFRTSRAPFLLYK
jgi:uncharacterized protein YbbC (DUF1343 family)